MNMQEYLFTLVVRAELVQISNYDYLSHVQSWSISEALGLADVEADYAAKLDTTCYKYYMYN